DFDSEIDSDEDGAESRKALKKLAKCHKPKDGVKQTIIGWKGQAYHYMLRVHKRVPHEKDCHSPTDSPIILTSPDYHTPIGRPLKKRRKSVAKFYAKMVKDGKLSRIGKTVTCIKYGEKGHNSRSCKVERVVNVTPSAQSNVTLFAPTTNVTPSAPNVRYSKSSARRLSPAKKYQIKTNSICWSKWQREKKS
nr:hypothetical protein [Tanacetum cinerariifolium]